MKSRSIVSLKGPFGTKAAEGLPAASDLATQVASWLKEASLAVEGPESNEDYAWDISTASGKATVRSLVGFVGDDPQQFLVTNHTSIPFWHGLFNRASLHIQADALLSTVCAILHARLSAASGVSEVRWYFQKDFDADHGDTWASKP